MNKPLEWTTEGRTWPYREYSQFVEAAGLRWHVQTIGDGPYLVLLHGTGASTHSWRDLIAYLAPHFKVVTLDLPGHGFTSLPGQNAMTLPGMAGAVAGLLRHIKVAPDVMVGHSAGAAIAIRMALDGAIDPRAIVSLNGALLPFPGVAALAFPALAKVLFLNPLSVPIAARLVNSTAAVARLIRRTGSDLDGAGIAYYARLFKNRRHVTATINMMANWDLHALKFDMQRLKQPLTLVSGGRDLAVPLWVARDVHARVPQATSIELPTLGHLAHEEEPRQIADLILKTVGSPKSKSVP